MRPYGNKRIENLTCKYGCCSDGCIHKGTGYQVPIGIRRRSRKRARQEARKTVKSA